MGIKRGIQQIISDAAMGLFPSYRQLQRDMKKLIGTLWILQNTVQLLEGILNRLMNEPSPTLEDIPEEYREKVQTMVRDHVILIANDMFSRNQGIRVNKAGVTVDMGELEIGDASIDEVEAAVVADVSEIEERRLIAAAEAADAATPEEPAS